MWEIDNLNREIIRGDFPGCLVVTTPCFQCTGHRFNPCLGNKDPVCCAAWLKTHTHTQNQERWKSDKCSVEDLKNTDVMESDWILILDEVFRQVSVRLT